MKRLLVMLVTVSLFGAMPAFAAEKHDMKMEHEGVRQCALQAETIQQKINRLETEVAKGGKKYDAKELKELKSKLDEANKILDRLNKP